MRKYLWIIMMTVLALLFISTAQCATPDQTKQIVLKFGHNLPPSMSSHKALLKFAAEVEAHTAGAVHIDIYPNSQLGGEMSMFEQVLSGTIDMAKISSTVMANAIPELNVMSLPFTLSSEKMAVQVMGDKDMIDKFFPIIRKLGIEPLSLTLGTSGRGIQTSTKPIKTPKDLVGLRMRVMESPMLVDLFKTLGASVVPIPFPEVYGALQQGVIDGIDGGSVSAINMKMIEVVKYATRTNHIFQISPVIAAKSAWAKLSEEQKKIVMEDLTKAIKISNDEETELNETGWNDLRSKYNLNTVNPLSDEQRKAFRDASASVIDKYRKVIGGELVDFYMNIISKYEKKDYLNK